MEAKQEKVFCQTTPKVYKVHYPAAVEFAEIQFQQAWPPGEYAVEEDVADILFNGTKADRHSLTEALKLFTHYELKVGVDLWLGRILKKYPHPACIQRMAASFGNAEMNYHAPFYFSLNEALHLDTEEFFQSYKLDPVLKERMDFLEGHLKSKDDLECLAAFVFLEGAILYSLFAFFKNYRANGNNKAKTLVAGINATMSDEHLHSLGGSWLFQVHMREACNLLKDEAESFKKQMQLKVEALAHKVLEHEFRVLDRVFSKGYPKGLCCEDMQNFVKSRLNLCMENLGFNPTFKVESNPIAEWFYPNTIGMRLHDMFQTNGYEYKKGWNEEKLSVWGQVE